MFKKRPQLRLTAITIVLLTSTLIRADTLATGQPNLSVLDELGYIPFTKEVSQLLFSGRSKSLYEHQSITVTSNLEFGRWKEVFGNDHLTEALLDRVIHHGHILTFSGESFRFKEAIANRKKSG